MPTPSRHRAFAAGESDAIVEFLTRLSLKPGEFRRDVVRLASEVFGLHRSIFWLIDERGEIYDPVLHGVEQQAIEAYVSERHYRTDVFHPHNLDMRALVGRNVLRVEDLLSRDRFESSPYYQRFLARHQVSTLLSVFFAKNGRLYGGLGVPRQANEPSFSKRDVRLLEAVAGQIAQVLAITQDLASAHRRALCFESFAESASTGLALLDDHGAVLYANPAAARICAGMQAGTSSSVPVEDFVRRLLEHHPRTWQDGFTSLTLSATLERWRVRLVPAVESGDGRFPCTYALSIESADIWGRRPVAQPVPEVALTARERTILELLVAGYTNQRIADELVISVHTVKKHVQHLFGKFGVRNRTSLCFAVGALGA